MTEARDVRAELRLLSANPAHASYAVPLRTCMWSAGSSGCSGRREAALDLCDTAAYTFDALESSVWAGKDRPSFRTRETVHIEGPTGTRTGSHAGGGRALRDACLNTVNPRAWICSGPKAALPLTDVVKAKSDLGDRRHVFDARQKARFSASPRNRHGPYVMRNFWNGGCRAAFSPVRNLYGRVY